MASFEMVYDESEDVLEITFETFDENFARTIALNDDIVLYTDTNLAVAWGITVYNYRSLLQAGSTQLDALAGVPEADVKRLWRILESFPAAHFIIAVDADQLLATLVAPNLLALIDR